MKKLFFIRHGKATHKSMPDKKRYLIEKGIKRTIKHAKQLKEKGITPDLIISSPAVRAYQTAELIAKTLNYPVDKIKINKNFYFEPEDLVINEILSLPNDAQTVFLVGHNPLWTDLADYYLSADIWHLRTSGIAGVGFDTDDWTEIENVPKKDLVLIN
jgi:phosphohistidine phosphatase